MHIFWVWINWGSCPKSNFPFRVKLQVRELWWRAAEDGRQLWQVLRCHGEFVVDCGLCCTTNWKSSIPVEVFVFSRIRSDSGEVAQLERRCRGETRIGSSCPERSVIGLWRRVPPPEGAPLAERGWNAVPAEFHKHAGTFCLFAMTNSSFNRANKTEHTCKRVN